MNFWYVESFACIYNTNSKWHTFCSCTFFGSSSKAYSPRRIKSVVNWYSDKLHALWFSTGVYCYFMFLMNFEEVNGDCSPKQNYWSPQGLFCTVSTEIRDSFPMRVVKFCKFQTSDAQVVRRNTSRNRIVVSKVHLIIETISDSEKLTRASLVLWCFQLQCSNN